MANVTAYNFFKVGNHFEYVKDGKLYTMTIEIVTCMIKQYRQLGYIVTETEVFITVCKIKQAV